MEYAKLGGTGLEVSRLCLGCMSFGVPERGNHPWSLDLDRATPVIRRALEAGINFFDTANVYSEGTSEEITGQVLRAQLGARSSCSRPRSMGECGLAPMAAAFS
jgi:aryl-alcohol dehydrogenase-like predicted oxidoreductase